MVEQPRTIDGNVIRLNLQETTKQVYNRCANCLEPLDIEGRRIDDDGELILIKPHQCPRIVEQHGNPAIITKYYSEEDIAFKNGYRESSSCKNCGASGGLLRHRSDCPNIIERF